jgi:hypothetical protein
MSQVAFRVGDPTATRRDWTRRRRLQRREAMARRSIAFTSPSHIRVTYESHPTHIRVTSETHPRHIRVVSESYPRRSDVNVQVGPLSNQDEIYDLFRGILNESKAFVQRQQRISIFRASSKPHEVKNAFFKSLEAPLSLLYKCIVK